MAPPKEFRMAVSARRLLNEETAVCVYADEVIGIAPPLGASPDYFAFGYFNGRAGPRGNFVEIEFSDGWHVTKVDGRDVWGEVKEEVRVPADALVYADGRLFKERLRGVPRGDEGFSTVFGNALQTQFTYASGPKRFMFVGGVHGVGKGSILKGAKLQGLNQVTFSAEMANRLAGQTGDTLNTLSYEKRRELVEEVYLGILNSQGGVVVDSHFSVPIMDEDRVSLERVESGILGSFLPNITDFVLVTADPGAVLDRRLKDPRARRITTPAILQAELKAEEQFGKMVADLAGKKLQVIDNTGDLLDSIKGFNAVLAA